MDYVRSCYSTKMQQVPGGPEVDVAWYFSDPDHLFPAPHRFGSLSWSRPNYGAGNIGEVIGRPRPWTEGYVPLGTDTTHNLYFGVEPFQIGAGDMRLSPWPITWRGERLFPGSPLGVPGLFPPYTFPGGLGTLTSNIHGVANALPPIPGRNSWNWPGRVPLLSVTWTTELLWQFYNCYPGMALMEVVKLTPAVFALRCASYDPATGRSTWVDSGFGPLDPGEVLTLDGTPGPPYPPA